MKAHIWLGEMVEAENARAELSALKAKPKPKPLPRRRCRAKVDGRQCSKAATHDRDGIPLCGVHNKVTFLDYWERGQ